MKKSTKNYNEIKDAGIKLNAETKCESKCAGKRFFAVMLLIVFASVMLFGCGEENSEKEKNSVQKQEQSEGSSDNKADKGTGKNAGKKDPGEKGSDKKKKKDNGKSSKSKNKRGSKKEKTSKNKNNKGESAEKSGGSQTGNKKSASKKYKTKNQSKSKSGKTNNKTKKKTSKNNTVKKYCWLKIQCKKLKGRKDLDPGTKSLVPKSGFILKKKKMEIKKGETVYSLITKARDKYRFALNVQDTAFGKYIAGIAGIEEKACGDESGWKYNVNGKYPDKSCSAVKVKAGDSIEWVYVLKANQK